MQGNGVDAVALVGGRWPVFKDVAEVGFAAAT